MKRIGIIFGGANSEHEVSVNSARSVAANLDTTLFEPVLFGIARDGRWHRVDAIDDLETATGGARLPDLEGIDIAFPVLHGRFGEDGTVQGLLELAAVPYVGCGVLASALAMDKLTTQTLLEARAAYEQDLRAAAAHCDGERLRPSVEGRRVRRRDGQVQVEAGP
ncbi:MAG: hypothetical protein V4479_01840, partial [Actinomycetota bacterium]